MIEPLSTACYYSTEKDFDARVNKANALLGSPHHTVEENGSKKRKATSMVRSALEQKTHGTSKLKQALSSFPGISERETSSSSDAANDKKAAQKLRNRLSAQQHRERQKKLLLDIRTELDCALAARRDLEWRVKELEHQNYALTFENQTLRQRLEEILLNGKSHNEEPPSLTPLASLPTTASTKSTTSDHLGECIPGPFSQARSLPSSLPTVAVGRPASPLVGDTLSLTRTPSPVPESETTSSDLYDIPLLFSTTSSGATSAADRWSSPSLTHVTRTPTVPGLSPSSVSSANYAELSAEPCEANSPEESAAMAKDVTDHPASDSDSGWSFFPTPSNVPADVDAVGYTSPTCLDLSAIVGSVSEPAQSEPKHQRRDDGAMDDFASCISEGLLSDRRGLLLSPMGTQYSHFAGGETFSGDSQLEADSTTRHLESRHHQGGCLSFIERDQFRSFSGFEKRQRLQSGVALSTHSPMQLLLCITLVLVTFLGLSPPSEKAGSSDYRATHSFGFLPQPAAAAINALTSTVTPYSSQFHWVPFDYFKSRAGPAVEFQLPAFSNAPSASGSSSDKLPPVIHLGFQKTSDSDKSVALADAGGGLREGPLLPPQKRLEGSPKDSRPRITDASQPPTKPSVANVLATRLLRDYLRLLCPDPTLIVGTSEELETFLETTAAAAREKQGGSATDEDPPRPPRLVLSVPISSLAAPAITHFSQADKDAGALSTQELLHVPNSDMPSVPYPKPQPVSASGWRNRSAAGASSPSLPGRFYNDPNTQTDSASSATPPIETRSPTAVSFDARAAWNMAVRETALRTLKAFTDAARGPSGNPVMEGGSSPSLTGATSSPPYDSNPLAHKHQQQERPSMPHHQRRSQPSSTSETLDDMPLHIICDQVNWDALYMKLFE